MVELPDYIKNRYWKDYLPPGITLEMEIPQNESLIDLFKRGTIEYGDKICLDFYGREYSFNDLDNLTRRFSKGLLDIGVNIYRHINPIPLTNLFHLKNCIGSLNGQLEIILFCLFPSIIARPNMNVSI